MDKETYRNIYLSGYDHGRREMLKYFSRILKDNNMELMVRVKEAGA